ncbi:MAG: ClbS/DfsB family four-helix bundle protein [Chloroflexi bacterium]|nr:MAG: ClbS/DfsB family four-helix bundle protein [Chloroflexota bacterium]
MVSTTILGTSKADLDKRIAQSYRALRSALEALPRERFTEKLRTGWSLNDNLAHLAAWEETVPPRVAGVLASGEDPKLYEDVDGFNARVARETKGKSTDDLFARWSVAHERLLETVRSLPEDAEKLAFDVVEWNTTGHYPDHYADIGAAIRTADDLLGLVQTPWIGFRLGVGAIGLPRFEEKTSTGWTFKDLVAHAAAWEERTASRLRTSRESGEGMLPGVDDADEFNAAVVVRTRGRDAREVIRELDAAHERVVDEIRKLGPEQLHANDDRVIAVVAGNTYGHYAEHFDELFAAVPKRPAELLEKMREGWRPFRRALNRLGLSALSETTPAGWTYKGMLGHLANWMEKIPGEMPNRLEGRRGPMADVNSENAREADESKSRSAHDAVERVHHAYQTVVDLVSALPADRDLNFMAMSLVVVYTYGHFVEHGRELEAAIPRTSTEFVQRIDAVWKPFRQAIRERGRAGLGERTPSGWTYKDLVAHAVGWMQQTVREMQSKEFRTGWTTETIQEFNDRSVRTHELVGAEAMVDELDTVYRRLVETVSGLGRSVSSSRKLGSTGTTAGRRWSHARSAMRGWK